MIYVLLGKSARFLLPFILIALALLGFVWYGWWIWAGLIFLLGRVYAEPLDQITGLDPNRRRLAVLVRRLQPERERERRDEADHQQVHDRRDLVPVEPQLGERETGREDHRAGGDQWSTMRWRAQQVCEHERKASGSACG